MKLIEIGKYRIDILKSRDYSEFKYRFHYVSELNDYITEDFYKKYSSHIFDFKLFRILFSRFISNVRNIQMIYNYERYYELNKENKTDI